MNDTLNELVEFLDKLAVRLDEWADDDETTAWEAMRNSADEARRMSEKIRKSVEVSPSDV